MTKTCNCCKKEYASLKEAVEKCEPIGVMQGGIMGYDLILVNCDCGSTLSINNVELMNELFKTQIAL